MGIKSTRILTRKEAEEQYMDNKAKIVLLKKRAKWQSQMATMSDNELAGILDQMAEEQATLENTTCFTNFTISETEAHSVTGNYY